MFKTHYCLNFNISINALVNFNYISEVKIDNEIIYTAEAGTDNNVAFLSYISNIVALSQF